MGWLDYHLWEMVSGGQTYGLPMDEDWGTTPRKPASRTRLRDVLASGTTRIDYTYDFGDNWEHTLIVSDVRAGDAGTAYPRYIAGERDCPPEDCGGIPGFYEMLEARADPEHPDHAEICEWLDGYDPDELDALPIEVALGRIAARRNAAAKRIIKPANDYQPWRGLHRMATVERFFAAAIYLNRSARSFIMNIDDNMSDGITNSNNRACRR
jgi:hypothetical protein